MTVQSNHTFLRATRLAAGVALACAGVAAHAVDFKAGDWDASLSGNVNGFITSNNNDKSTTTTVLGGLAGQGTDTTGIHNGLLPNALVFSAKTRQNDFDISATIGLYPTIDTTAAGQTLGSNINARQGFLTFGDKSWGTVKIGRDLGIFGSDAILNDMTLLSVGVGATPGGGPTTLGRIGTGYLYADWIPQISYTSPAGNPFSVSIGVFQPLQSLAILNGTGQPALSTFTDATSTSTKQPGFQGKASFDFSNSGVSGKVWGGFVTQQLEPVGVSSYTATAYELGLKAGVGDFNGVVYAYDGDGVGTTLLLLGGADQAGNKRKSDGYYLQGTYAFGPAKFGLSYGESKLKLASDENTALVPTLVSKNKSAVAGIYYSLTKSLTLVGEYVNTKSENQGGGSVKQDTYALGGILFF